MGHGKGFGFYSEFPEKLLKMRRTEGTGNREVMETSAKRLLRPMRNEIVTQLTTTRRSNYNIQKKSG